MKNSSMKTAPKGSTPPTRTAKAGCMYHACGGMLRGMRFVFVGYASGSARPPRCAPAKTRGTEIPAAARAARGLKEGRHRRRGRGGRTEPEEHEDDESTERDGARGLLAPDEHVEHEEKREDDAGEHERRLQRHYALLAALERFVQARRDVSRDDAAEDEAEHHRRHQPCAVESGAQPRRARASSPEEATPRARARARHRVARAASRCARGAPPRFDGDKKPKTANAIVTTVHARTCAPVPTYTASSPARGGVRKTSPWTCAFGAPAVSVRVHARLGSVPRTSSCGPPRCTARGLRAAAAVRGSRASTRSPPASPPSTRRRCTGEGRGVACES